MPTMTLRAVFKFFRVCRRSGISALRLGALRRDSGRCGTACAARECKSHRCRTARYLHCRLSLELSASIWVCAKCRESSMRRASSMARSANRPPPTSSARAGCPHPVRDDRDQVHARRHHLLQIFQHARPGKRLALDQFVQKLRLIAGGAVFRQVEKFLGLRRGSGRARRSGRAFRRWPRDRAGP